MHYLDNFGGSDEVDGVVTVFLHACTDGEDVGVKDDVIGVKSHFADQQSVGPSADLHFTVCICGLERTAHLSADVGLILCHTCMVVGVCLPPHLPLLIKGHDNDSSSVTLHSGSSEQELLLSFLQTDTVDYTLSLTAFQSSLNH